MRTRINALSKTCPECGTQNRLYFFTTGLSPSWRIACSNCIGLLVDPRAADPRATDPRITDPHTTRVGFLAAPKGDQIAEVTPLPRKTDAGLRMHLPGSPVRRSRQNHATGRPDAPGRPRLGYNLVGLLTACSLALAALLGSNMVWNGLDEGSLPDQRGDTLMAAAATPEQNALPSERIEAPYIVARNTGDMVPALGLSLRAKLDFSPHVPRPPRDIRTADAGSDPNPGERDARESMAQLQDSVFRDPVAAAASEAALDLSPAERRSIQQRLLLAKYDTNGVDGIFGRATRSAIAAWQSKAGLEPSGFATGPTFSRLIAETDAAYRAWHLAEVERRNADLHLVMAVPTPRPEAGNASAGCPRLATGEIAYGESFICDVKGLKENLRSIKGTFAQALDQSDRPSRQLGRGPGDA